MTYSKGDAIQITCDDRTIDGWIIMISENQVSALIGFETILGKHAGMMPIMRRDLERGVYRSIIDGTEVTMRRKA
jgi:hypothetical protein